MAFYRSLEEEFGETIWHPMPVLRLASSEKEWAKISAKRDLPEVRPWMASEHPVTPIQSPQFNLPNSISQTICVILFLNLGLTVVGRVGE
jgi:hypothetical protein